MSQGDLTGQTFGQLRVVGVGARSSDYTFWNCSCSCGNLRVVEENRLMSGKVTRCLECESQTKTTAKAN